MINENGKTEAPGTPLTKGLPVAEVIATETADGTLFTDENMPADSMADGKCQENSATYTENCDVLDDDVRFMRRAMELAREAEKRDEVPVGAVITRRGEIIAEGFNTREGDKCAVCHAEINAITAACRALGGWRLPETVIYVTMEPCAMCAGAIMNARIPRVVYGAPDLRFGAMGSLFDLSEMAVNHRPKVTRGVLGEECAGVLTAYFKRKRG